MANGTVLEDIKIYYAAGGVAIGAKKNDRVIGDGQYGINVLIRAGETKLSYGNYVLPGNGLRSVRWDEVTPPPDPTVTERIEYYRTENGVTTVTRFIPE